MPEMEGDDYRPSAAIGGDWRLPSTLARSVGTSSLTAASSLAGTSSLVAAAPSARARAKTQAPVPASRAAQTTQDVWSDITIAHDSAEVQAAPVDPGRSPARRGPADADGPAATGPSGPTSSGPTPIDATVPVGSRRAARTARAAGDSSVGFGTLPSRQALQGIGTGMPPTGSRPGRPARPVRPRAARPVSGARQVAGILFLIWVVFQLLGLLFAAS